jgi:hypothetical protein
MEGDLATHSLQRNPMCDLQDIESYNRSAVLLHLYCPLHLRIGRAISSVRSRGERRRRGSIAISADCAAMDFATHGSTAAFGAEQFHVIARVPPVPPERGARMDVVSARAR